MRKAPETVANDNTKKHDIPRNLSGPEPTNRADVNNEQRRLRAHYIRSIYDLAWERIWAGNYSEVWLWFAIRNIMP